MKKTCSICKKNLEKKRLGKQRYCLACHAKNQRENRKRWKDLTPAEKRKATARATARVYERRGLLKRKPCEDCGDRAEEKHHEDYSKPLEIVWLCRKCHLRRHSKENEAQVTVSEVVAEEISREAA